MRISDWSSDVCSSDLGGRVRGVELHFDPGLPEVVPQPRAAERPAGAEPALGGAGRPGGAAGKRDRAGAWPGADRRRLLGCQRPGAAGRGRSEEHTSELQSLMRISYAVFCLKKKKQTLT